MASKKNQETEIPALSEWIHIFTAGNYPQARLVDGKVEIVDVEVSLAHIKKVAANFDGDWQDAPIWIGHENKEQPALGWIAALKVVGNKLYARFKDMTPELVELIKSKKYKYVSVELYIYTRDGQEIEYLGALALTNFPLVLGLEKLQKLFDENVEALRLAATNSTQRIGKLESLHTVAIDRESFLKAMSPENLNNTNMELKDSVIGKFGASIGLRVSDFSTEESVLAAAEKIINELRNKFTDEENQPCSLDMFLAKCSAELSKVTTLEADLNTANENLETVTAQRNTAVVEAAIAADKILPAEKEVYEGSLKNDFLKASQYLSTKPALGLNASNTINNSTATGAAKAEVSADRTAWGYTEWSKNDPKGLKGLKATNPAAFKKVFEKTYGEGTYKED